MNKKIIVLITFAALTLLSAAAWHTQKSIFPEQPTPSPALKQKFAFGSCQKCGKALRKVNGKFGEFISCSGYPECKFILRDKASFACLTCGTGSVERRPWSGGVLWGCSNYPECRFAIFSDIVDKPCTVCNQSPYLLKTLTDNGTQVISCPKCKG